MDGALNNIANRIDHIQAMEDPQAGGGTQTTEEKESPAIESGVSSGDETSAPKGFWISGSYAASKEDPYGSFVGYKGLSQGFTVGGDIAVNDSLIVGVSYSLMHSKFKYRQDRTGDATSAVTHIGSVYFANSLSSKLLWQTVLLTGRSSLSNKRLVNNDTMTASSRFTNNSYTVESALNYKLPLNQLITIKPSVGLRYSHYLDGAYTETGGGIYNLSVGKDSNDILLSTVGVKAILPELMFSKFSVTPRVQASIENTLINKNNGQDLGENLYSNSFNNGRNITYNAGASLLVSYLNSKTLISYNSKFRKRYLSQQLTFRFRFLF